MAFLDWLCGVLEREFRDVLLMEFRDGLGFDPHFRGRFNFIYNFYYIDSVPLSKSGVLGFIDITLVCNNKSSLNVILVIQVFYLKVIVIVSLDLLKNILKVILILKSLLKNNLVFQEKKKLKLEISF